MRNLRIEELSAGSLVQKLDIKSGKLTLPMKVLVISDNGALTLEKVDGMKEETEIGSVCPVQINDYSLEGLGFSRTKGDNVWFKAPADMRLTVALRYRGGVQECRRCAISGKIACWNEEIRYIHELQRWWNDRVLFPFGIPLELEWKGIKDKKE